MKRLSDYETKKLSQNIKFPLYMYAIRAKLYTCIFSPHSDPLGSERTLSFLIFAENVDSESSPQKNALNCFQSIITGAAMLLAVYNIVIPGDHSSRAQFFKSVMLLKLVMVSRVLLFG